MDSMDNQEINAIARLKQDYISMKKDPIQHVAAEPTAVSIFTWYFVFCGPENTLYEGGYYFGQLDFPKEYPYKPPIARMYTLNGRFRAGAKLCLSISDHDLKEWNPAWNVSTFLKALFYYWLDDESDGAGTIAYTDDARRSFADESLITTFKFHSFHYLFPELAEEVERKLHQKNIGTEGLLTYECDSS